MGLTDRNKPQSFEELANAEEREVKSESKVQPPVNTLDVTIRQEVKKRNWFQRFFKPLYT